jgi:hypothetical protein
LNTLADLANATTLFLSIWRSMDCTPNAICGCWSMISWLFCGVKFEVAAHGCLLGCDLSIEFGRLVSFVTGPCRTGAPRHRQAFEPS